MGRRAAMKRGQEASRGVEGSVEVVRDDGLLMFIYWNGVLQGCVDKR